MNDEQKPTKLPSLKQHTNGQAVAYYKGNAYYFGRYGTPLAEERFKRFLVTLLSDVPQPRRTRDPLSVRGLAREWGPHVLAYYTKAGKRTSEVDLIAYAMRYLVNYYGEERAANFGPSHLKGLQSALIVEGLSRVTINKYIDRVRRLFRWAVAEELVPGDRWERLRAVPNLRKGRSEARELPPVQPVEQRDIEALCRVLPPPLASMVRVHALCGARPGEIVGLRPCDIDSSEEVWRAQLTDHKTSHIGRTRTLYFGPEARALLRPLLVSRRGDMPLFSPKEAQAWRNQGASTHRRPDQKPTPTKTDREVGDAYTVGSYRRALTRASAEAGIVPAITPNRLRHTAATRIRRKHGLDAAQAVLGHASADITQVYAELDAKRAAAIMEEMG